MTSSPWYTVLAIVMLMPSIECKVTLRHLDTAYIPETYNDGQPQFRYDTGAAYIVGFDPANPFLYVAGESVIHVLNYTDPNALTRAAYHKSDIGFTYTALDVCGDLVAASFDNENHPLEGMVYVFNTLKGEKGESFEPLQQIQVGPQPAMVKFTENCQKLLVPLSGPVVKTDGEITDSEGAIAFIDLKDKGRTHNMRILNFTDFNDKWEDYVNKGVRWPWRGNETDLNTTFSQGLEPNFITIDNGTTAYVSFQVNNAMAKLNVETEQIDDLVPLGATWWNASRLDASDKDGGINLTNWDIYGMYQPQKIRLALVGDTNYVLTADGGVYTKHTFDDVGFDWKDKMRGEDLFHGGPFGLDVSDSLKSHLADDRKLGRLFFSKTDGRETSSGKITKLHTFGARSFSIRKASDLSLMYNSQGSLEQHMATLYPDAFNAESENEAGAPMTNMDDQSPFMGPHPSCVEYAELELSTGTKRLVFVGMDKPGMLAIYSVADDFDSSKQVQFESMLYTGGPADKTWQYAWEKHLSRDLGVYDLKVYHLPGNDGSNGNPILAVAGYTTDTVSLYAIYDDEADNGLFGLSMGAAVGMILVACFVVLAVIVALAVRYVIVRKRRDNYGHRTLMEETA